MFSIFSSLPVCALNFKKFQQIGRFSQISLTRTDPTQAEPDFSLQMILHFILIQTKTLSLNQVKTVKDNRHVQFKSGERHLRVIKSLRQ